MLLLTIVQGPDKGKAFNLPPNEPQLIGRSSEALRITDYTVSRRHAEPGAQATRVYLNRSGKAPRSLALPARTEYKPAILHQ